MGGVSALTPMRHASDAARHPLIYVYNTSSASSLARFMDERSDTQLQEWAFGRKLGADFWGTDTWATVAILFYRLHRHREWITTDPSIADLFVMPLVPASPEYRTATKHPEDFKVATKTMCDHIFHDQLDLAYHYLNEESAPRHVFCAVEYTPVLAFCAMAGYSRKPASHRLLSRMRWFIHEDFELSRSAPLAYYSSLGLPGSQPVTAVNIPFPSGAAHSVSTLRQAARGNRPYLLSFVGSLNGSHEGRAIRTEISRQCATAGSPACHTLQIRAGMISRRAGPRPRTSSSGSPYFAQSPAGIIVSARASSMPSCAAASQWSSCADVRAAGFGRITCLAGAMSR